MTKKQINFVSRTKFLYGRTLQLSLTAGVDMRWMAHKSGKKYAIKQNRRNIYRGEITIAISALTHRTSRAHTSVWLFICRICRFDPFEWKRYYLIYLASAVRMSYRRCAFIHSWYLVLQSILFLLVIMHHFIVVKTLFSLSNVIDYPLLMQRFGSKPLGNFRLFFVTWNIS